MDIGFHKAGYEIVWANDIDPTAVETYRSLFPKHEAVAGDIRTVQMPDRKDIDVVIGGPPCQGFSVAGKMDPNDARSRHVWDFMAVVKKYKPQAFVMENVKALAVNKRWSQVLAGLVEAAEIDMNYSTKLFVLNSAHFGVPQSRERMFLIGTRGGTERISIVPTTEKSPLSVEKALHNLPAYGEPGNDSYCKAIITLAKNPILRKSPYAGMLFNGQGRPLDLKKPALTLPASMGGNRTPIIDQKQLAEQADPWVEKYHSSLLHGKKPLKRIPKSLRRLTVEEAAAIQTFPKGMLFKGRQSARFRQIGNAVPPTLAFHVASNLYKSYFST